MFFLSDPCVVEELLNLFFICISLLASISDIAISAPYGGPGDSGTVYIYYGSDSGNYINPTPQQV